MPHIVVIGSFGHVAVANSDSDDLSLFSIGSGGLRRLDPLGKVPLGTSPRALAITRDTTSGFDLVAAVRSPQPGVKPDKLRRLTVEEDGRVTKHERINAGFFATDLAVADNQLFVATATKVPQDQIRAYAIDPTSGRLTLVGSVTAPAGVNFKQLAAFALDPVRTGS